MCRKDLGYKSVHLGCWESYLGCQRGLLDSLMNGIRYIRAKRFFRDVLMSVLEATKCLGGHQRCKAGDKGLLEVCRKAIRRN